MAVAVKQADIGTDIATPVAPAVSHLRNAAPTCTAGATPASSSSLERILAVEDRFRAAASELEFEHCLANDLRALVGARQIVVLRKTNMRHWRVACVSSMANVERDAPLIRAIESFAAKHAPSFAPDRATLSYLDAVAPHDQELIAIYPFREALWLPVRFRGGAVFAGLLFLRERPWGAGETELLQREAPIISDTWCAIAGRRSLRPATGLRRALMAAAAVTVLAAMAIPVPMTTLAPVEIVARNPYLVTAPINGVIDKILAEPNHQVAAGQPLLGFVDTDLRNAWELARREADVAISRHGQLSQAAFSDEKSRHDVSIAVTEMKLRIAERDYARERLDKVTVRAGRGGLLIYPDKSKLLGRPVSVGERLMRIASPGEVAGEVALPVADAIVLEQGARVRLFLDADPTHALDARVQTESYHAEPDPTGALVYAVRVSLADPSEVPRIGSRGTAQLFGSQVPLGFFLFRRPIAWARQKFGF